MVEGNVNGVLKCLFCHVKLRENIYYNALPTMQTPKLYFTNLVLLIFTTVNTMGITELQSYLPAEKIISQPNLKHTDSKVRDMFI
jgi:hypothetical protein